MSLSFLLFNIIFIINTTYYSARSRWTKQHVNTKKYHVFAPMGRFQLESIYLYFPPSSQLAGTTVENKGKLIKQHIVWTFLSFCPKLKSYSSHLHIASSNSLFLSHEKIKHVPTNAVHILSVIALSCNKNGVCLRPHGRSENILTKCSYKLSTIIKSPSNHNLSQNFASIAKFILHKLFMKLYMGTAVIMSLSLP